MNDNRKLQLIQTEIVVDIDRICNENGLRYYMIGGTLLGAVRHQGFIPWDDDIDLVMYRDDYDKLIDIIQKNYSQKYFVQTFYTDKYYTRYIAKIRLNNTTLIESYLENSHSNNGIYVDIFPLDHVKKSKGFGLQLRGSIVRWLFAYKTVRNGIFISKSKFKRFFIQCLRWTTYLVPQKFVNWLFDYVCSKDNNKDCKYTTNFASHFKWKKQLFPNEVYGEGVRLEFEGHMFNAPSAYLDILERLYGKKYMELPPKEKQITHEIIKLDFGPYDIKRNDIK